jgi:hypothetical protein
LNAHPADLFKQTHYPALDGIQRPDGQTARWSLHTDAEQARALAQALLVAADEYEQMAGYDQITVFNNSCFDSEPGGYYVDCDGRRADYQVRQVRVGGVVTMPIGGMQNRLRQIPRLSRLLCITLGPTAVSDSSNWVGCQFVFVISEGKFFLYAGPCPL